MYLCRTTDADISYWFCFLLYIDIGIISICEEIYFRNWFTWLPRLRVPQSALYELENQGSWRCNSVHVCRLENQECQRLRAEDGCPRTQAERGNSLFLLLPVLFRPARDWIMPTCIGEGICFLQSTDSDLFPEIPSQTHPEIMSSWLSRYGLAQSSQHIKLTISVDVFIVFNMGSLAEEVRFLELGSLCMALLSRV